MAGGVASVDTVPESEYYPANLIAGGSVETKDSVCLPEMRIPVGKMAGEMS